MSSFKFHDWNASTRNAICQSLFKDCVPDDEIPELLQKIKLLSKGNLDHLIQMVYEGYSITTTDGWDVLKKYLSEGKIGFQHPLFLESMDNEQKEINKIETPLEVDENSMYMCSKCKLRKTMFYSRQVRRSDEPPTVFIFCMNKTCRHSWTEG